MAFAWSGESRLKELGFEWNVDFNNIEGAVRGARAPAPPRALTLS